MIFDTRQPGQAGLTPFENMGILSKIGLVLQSAADPSVIPKYQAQLQDQQERQFRIDELKRQREKEQLQNLALANAMPMFKAGDIDGGFAALSTVPEFADNAMSYYAEKANKGVDLKALAEAYALKRAANQQPTDEEIVGAKAWEAINHSEIDYDPNTGMQRPKYASLAGFGDVPAVQMDGDVFPVQYNSPAAPMLSGPPMPGQMEALANQMQSPQMPAGLFPKAQLTFQEESVKENFANRAKTKEQIEGQQELDELLTQMMAIYDELDASVATPSTQRGMFENVWNSLATTDGFDVNGQTIIPGGQQIGRMAGSPYQAKRDELNAKIPLLKGAIKKATGASAQEMNSNTELQQFLKAVTNQQNAVEANRSILESLSDLYGAGTVKATAPRPADPKVTLKEKYGLK